MKFLTKIYVCHHCDTFLEFGLLIGFGVLFKYLVFFRLFILSASPLRSFCSHNLLQKRFLSFTLSCFKFMALSSPTDREDVLPLFWKLLFGLSHLSNGPVFLCYPSFTNILWFISFCCVVSHVIFRPFSVFSFLCILVYFSLLTTFTYCWNLLCTCNLIYDPVFMFARVP